MKIGIMVLSIGSFGKKGFYNLQEIGLAKALDSLCNEIQVYKLVSSSEDYREQIIEGTQHSIIHYMPSRSVGTNGIPDMNRLDKDLDVLICFSDTQLALPRVFRWAQKNRILMLPYIGVVESHSTSRLKKKIVDVLFQRCLAVYRECHCLVKTPTVMAKLAQAGVDNITVVPVGLDLSLLREEDEKTCSRLLKNKYGYSEEDKVLLFIGRLIEEKQPIRMIEILSEIRKEDQTYKLLMVGNGELKAAVEKRVKELNLSDVVQMIERIPNSEIWELYRFANAFVNLNQQEIFGMAILEAMYYGCKVVAWKAPGPNLIIENGKSGWLTESNEEVIENILDTTDVGEEAHQRVLREFTWESSAKKILSTIGE